MLFEIELAFLFQKPSPVFFLNVLVFLLQREFERGVQDCDSALCVSDGSRRALFRKALCLGETGRLRDAYECVTKCLLTAPQVRRRHSEHQVDNMGSD